MKTEFQNKAEKFWDRNANSYDKEEKKDKEIYELIFEKTKVFLKSTDIVLDIGCGTGLISNEISKVVKNVDAIDLSSEMIKLAKVKAEKLNVKNIKYTHTTVFDEKLKQSSYDVIICFYVLHLLENHQETILRINKLLKPNGILISVTPCMGEKPFLGRVFSVFSKIGIVPKIKLFNQLDLKELILESFNIVESECLPKTSNQYFIVAKK